MHKSLDKFKPYVEKKLLREVISPCKKLVLYNYTDLCTYERAWDEVTLNARGTVYEIETGKVVARAFPKFFNFSELSTEKQKEVLNAKSFETFEKMDGSLGIVYYYDGEWRVNTRGSFTSDQAIKGKLILEQNYSMSDLNKDFTLLVEIIYPENKIIVDYKNREFLSLLAVNSNYNEKTDRDFVKEVSEFVDMSRAPSVKFDTIEELQSHLETLDHTEEGYVVRLNTGERVKFKSAEYLKVARIMNHLSPLSLWKAMENGKVKVDYLEHLPEEFRKEVEEITEKLEKQYRDILRCYNIDFADNFMRLDFINGHEVSTERKGIAQISKEKGLNLSAMFAILDGKEEVLDRIIMKELRPKSNKMEE